MLKIITLYFSEDEAAPTIEASRFHMQYETTAESVFGAQKKLHNIYI
jgi:hypothetical protein